MARCAPMTPLWIPRASPCLKVGMSPRKSIMDTVNNNDNSIYYIVKELSPQMRDVGRRTVRAFDVKSRFVHLEFFVLNDDQPGLGKKGDILGLR